VKLKKGQTVIFAKYGPEEIKVGGKEYLIVSESNILAVID
jgi:chaperonin GroES